MSDIRKELTICPDCEGQGWYTDHSDLHHHRQDLGCSDCGCPIQRECETCEATGLIYKKDVKEIEKVKDFEPEDDLPF